MCFIFAAYILDFILYVVFAFFLQSYVNSSLSFMRFIRRSFTSTKKIKNENEFVPIDLSENNELNHRNEKCKLIPCIKAFFPIKNLYENILIFKFRNIFCC